MTALEQGRGEHIYLCGPKVVPNQLDCLKIKGAFTPASFSSVESH